MTAKEAMELLESLIQTKKLIKIVLSDQGSGCGMG